MKKDKKQLKSNKTSVGGQAVIEGVMMRGKTAMATSVRDSDGIIRTESKRIKPLSKRSKIFRLPIIRGVISFFDSMIGGTKVLLRSAEVYGEEEPTRFEKWLANKLHVNLMGVISFISLVLGLGLAIVLFIWLPQLSRTLLEKIVGSEFDLLLKNLIEGGFKLLIFVMYILLCSLIKDVKRTFMYHGAEHKTISCYEKGLDLSVENVRKCSRVHDRCGTTFIVFVLIISILVFAGVEALIGESVNGILRVLLKLSVFPLVAGLSYELLKALSKTNSKIFLPLKAPGMLLQCITTKEPDDKMLEVAITAFTTVMQMDNDQDIPEKEFVTAKKRKDLTESVVKRLSEKGITETSEAEWIVSIALDIKRDEVYQDKIVTPKYVEKVEEILLMRLTGRPLWYCIGNTDFYGYVICVDERVLIPRSETELLVENAIKHIDANSKVLDLCTGSGAIAIAVKGETNASVTAVDISEDALELAKENARLNGLEINFLVSDMFANLKEQKFDVIISNPPYIRSKEIKSLQNEIVNFEPILALDGGEDGLDFYRIIADNAKKYLTENGKLLLEVGYDQADEVIKLFGEYKNAEKIKDYEGIERIVKVDF